MVQSQEDGVRPDESNLDIGDAKRSGSDASPAHSQSSPAHSQSSPAHSQACPASTSVQSPSPSHATPTAATAAISQHATTTSRGQSHTLHALARSHRWFSLFPRTCCDRVVSPPPQQKPPQLPPPVAVVAPHHHHQQQQYFIGNPYGQQAYTYITSGGAVFAQGVMQPIGMGYGMLGMPQGQYIAVNSSPPVQYIIGGGGNQQDVQYVTFGSENQLVVMPSASEPGKSAGNASAAASASGGPSDAPPTRPYAGSSPAEKVVSSAIQRDTPPASSGGVPSSSMSSLGGGAQQQSASGSAPQPEKVSESDLVTTVVNPAATSPAGATTEATPTPQAPYYSIMLQVGGEGQYITVPADPRVLSGQCSYVMVQQPDGTQQLALMENYPTPAPTTPTPTPAAADPQPSVDVRSPSSASPQPPLQDVDVMFECPSASLAANEGDGDPYCVEIVLLYAEQVREATPPSPKVKVQEKGQEKSLLQLLDAVDKGKEGGGGGGGGGGGNVCTCLFILPGIFNFLFLCCLHT